MKISYNWLRDYLPVSMKPAEIAEILTGTGLEVESVEKVEKIPGGLAGVFVGQVIECVKHPDADRLRLTKVDLGIGEPVQIVCGAPNVDVGQKVLVATIGTTLYPSAGDPLTIKKGKIRGQESAGMICAEDELGLGTSHDGILILDNSAVVGTPAAEHLQLQNDYCLEIGLTPNRTDAISHYGVARDLFAAINHKNDQQQTLKLIKPDVSGFKAPGNSSNIQVTVSDPAGCPRYSGIVIGNIVVGPSPSWLRERLSAIGLRPINNIVDITNYVQHETGQPLHAFDADKIEGNTIIVRSAKQGEKFITLDGIERTLNSGDQVICDASKPMCIAGIFGGLHSGVTDSTTTIFLESAYFDPVVTRKTARRNGLHTDSSFRFERGTDPEQTVYALKRATMLIGELAGGIPASEVVDIYPSKIPTGKVIYRWTKTNELIGHPIEKSIVKNILRDLEIKVESENEESLTLSIPHFRNEVTREVDVVEEVLRIYGYDNVPFPKGLRTSISYAIKPDPEAVREAISNFLSSNGYSEMMSMSLTKTKYAEGLTNTISLLNPLSGDLGIMRPNLLFSGLEAIGNNKNYRNTDLRLYEFGKSYFRNDSKFIEDYHLGIFLTGKKFPESWNNTGAPDFSFADIKGIVENIATICGVDNLKLESASHENYSDSLTMHFAKNKIAEIAIVAPSLLMQFDIEQPVYYADILWSNLLKLSATSKTTYHEPDKFPSVRRDLSLLLDKSITFSEIEQIARSAEKNILRQVGLFDVYEGKNLPQGKKSYAVNFILQDPSKTMNDKQVEQIMEKIVNSLKEKLSAELR